MREHSHYEAECLCGRTHEAETVPATITCDCGRVLVLEDVKAKVAHAR